MTEPTETDARPYPAAAPPPVADRSFMAEFEEARAAVDAAGLTNEECRMIVGFVVGHTPAAIMSALDYVRHDRDNVTRWHEWRACPNGDAFTTSIEHAGQCRVCNPADTAAGA